jgi:hypothetical protein
MWCSILKAYPGCFSVSEGMSKCVWWGCSSDLAVQFGTQHWAAWSHLSTEEPFILTHSRLSSASHQWMIQQHEEGSTILKRRDTVPVHATEAYGRCVCVCTPHTAPLILTLALDVGEWSASQPRDRAPITWMGNWVHPRVGLEVLAKKNLLPRVGTEPWIVQPTP